MKVYAYHNKCTDCNVEFYVEDQGQLDGHVGACPMCEEDNQVIDLGKVKLEVLGI